MARAHVCLLILSLASCSQNSGPLGFGPNGFSGNVELQACGLGSDDPELPRCAAAAKPGTIAAVCGDLDERNTLTVSSGSLAVSGRSRLSAPLRVNDGSFTSYGDIEADNTQDIDEDLSTAGDWSVHAPAHVGGNAVVGGSLEASNTITVKGTLHAASSDATYVSAKTVTSRDLQVDDPLACDDAPSPAAVIQSSEALGVRDLGDVLSAHSQPAQVSLGCARYRFSSFGIDNELTFHVSGRTVIVVDGDVRVASPMRVELDDGASLDFVIGGALQIDNTLSFSGGSTWLAVGGAITIGAPLELSGFLYAPQSTLSVNNTLDVRGSVLAESMTIAAPVNITASSHPALPACSVSN